MSPWRCGFAVLVFFLATAPLAVAASRRPNVVVILADDAGYQEFSMQGSRVIRTPRIDSIAANGVRFTQGYVSGTVCSPSRAGLLTGRYQQRFGHELNIPPVYSDEHGLPLTEATLADVLKTAGYRTIAIGKWHLGYAPHFQPLARGFTDFYGFLQGSRSYRPLENPDRLNRILRGRDPEPEAFDYLTDKLGEEAAAFIHRHKSEPFFMYLAFNATHSPKQTKDADLAAAGGDAITAMTIALDRAVGLVLDAVREESLENDTLLFFLNDNGGANGHDNGMLRGHKGSAWEGGVRVPFAVQWSGVLPKGKVVDTPVIALDIFPTAMAAAGIEMSTDKPLDGIDLVPFLTGAAPPPHRTLYWKTGRAAAVRDGELKLVVSNAGIEAPQLFNIVEDPREIKDIAPQRQRDVARLLAMYESWRTTHVPTPWGGAKAVRKAAKEDNEQ